MITVTFFKKRGDKTADDFRVSLGNRGDPLGEWDYLTLDKQLKAMKINFTVVEYLHADMLINGYAARIKQPITIDLRYGENYASSTIYSEKSPLDAANIRQWIINAVKKVAPEYLNVVDPVITTHFVPDSAPLIATVHEPESETKSSSAVKPTDNTTANADPTNLEDTASSLFKLGLGVGGTLLVAAMAIAGVAMGSFAADRFNNDEDGEFDSSSTPDEHPLFLEGLDGSKLDFAKIWEERPPGSVKPSKTKANKTKKTMNQSGQVGSPINSEPKIEKSSDTEPKPKSNGPFDIEDPTIGF
jgi:hypothetical protein